MSTIESFQPKPERVKILIVDDEQVNIKLFKMYLRQERYQTIAALNGEEALEKIASEDPTLVLLDVMMPGLDGFEVCRRIKHNPKTMFLPVVLVTSLNEVEHRVQGAEAGADDFLAKPVHAPELVTRVKSLVRIKVYHDALMKYATKLEQMVTKRTHQLERALSDLERLDQYKANILANVSHELRTPLTPIKLSLALLEDGTLGPTSKEQREHLEVMTNATNRLQKLVEALIQFAHWDPDKMARRPVSVHELLNRTLVGAEYKASLKDITLKKEIPLDLPPVLGDHTALSTVLEQLVDNAIKFSPHDSAVLIEANRAEQPDWIRFSITDYGTGIPKEEFEHIFNSFYQIDSSITRRYGGTGIGLALVKLIISAHNSTVTVKSKVGEGSTFSFPLPVAKS